MSHITDKETKTHQEEATCLNTHKQYRTENAANPRLADSNIQAFPQHGCVLRAKLLQSCLTLCDPMQPVRLLCPSESLGKNTGVGCHALPGVLPNPGIKLPSLTSPTWAGRFFTISAIWESLSPACYIQTTVPSQTDPVKVNQRK